MIIDFDNAIRHLIKTFHNDSATLLHLFDMNAIIMSISFGTYDVKVKEMQFVLS